MDTVCALRIKCSTLRFQNIVYFNSNQTAITMSLPYVHQHALKRADFHFQLHSVCFTFIPDPKCMQIASEMLFK